MSHNSEIPPPHQIYKDLRNNKIIPQSELTTNEYVTMWVIIAKYIADAEHKLLGGPVRFCSTQPQSHSCNRSFITDL
jgi:hypothetical protein